MKLFLIIFAVAAVAVGSHAAEPRIVGYFAEWSVYDRNYHINQIPAEKLTHVNYAFAKIVNGECSLFDPFAAIEKPYPGDPPANGNFNRLVQLKKKHPHLKTLISVGGWTLSGPFSDVASAEESRVKFAKSCVAFMKKYHFDGIDIDWEYPVGGGMQGNKNRPEDKSNYILLLAELRKQLDAAGKADKASYLLTIAAPAGPRSIANFELDRIHPHVDWINVMTYDFHGAWDEKTNLCAPLHLIKVDPAQDETSKKLNVEAAIKTFLAAGVPSGKIVMGVPFFGHGWNGVKDANNGLFQPRKGIPKGTWEEGLFDYKDLAANYVGKFKRHWQPDAMAPWLFDEKSGIMISYEDPESIRAKAAYARELKLGGVMVWELSADDKKASLLSAIGEGWKGK